MVAVGEHRQRALSASRSGHELRIDAFVVRVGIGVATPSSTPISVAAEPSGRNHDCPVASMTTNDACRSRLAIGSRDLNSVRLQTESIPSGFSSRRRPRTRPRTTVSVSTRPCGVSTPTTRPRSVMTA